MTLRLVRDGREFLAEPGDELGTDLGVLTVPESAEPGDEIETHLGEAFRVRRLRSPDLFEHFERTGAPMLPRDVGLIVGHVGVEVGDRILDVGTGTGVLAAFLARMGAEVDTYERRAEFAAVARENMRLAGVEDRVTVHDADPTEGGFDPTAVDVVTLDSADAPALVELAVERLTPGGYLAAYSPFVEDAKAVAAAATAAGFAEVETVETLQREMDFDDRGSRPSTAPVGHSGYLTFGRLL